MSTFVKEVDIVVLFEKLLTPIEKLNIFPLMCMPIADIQEIYRAYSWIKFNEETSLWEQGD